MIFVKQIFGEFKEVRTLATLGFILIYRHRIPAGFQPEITCDYCAKFNRP